MGTVKGKWSADHYVTAYELARQGMTRAEVAGVMGVSTSTLYGWIKKYPAFARAFERGEGHKARHGEGELDFNDYIYGHLPDHLRDLWDEIMACEEAGNHQDRIEALLKGQGKRGVQHLFIHSLVSSGFNVSRSLRRLCVSRKRFEGWVANDPEFAELMDQIHACKKDFFEQAFIGRVAAGDTPAIIHAVKTQLRDRGYNDKVEMVVEHEHRHRLEVEINLADLDLPIDVRRVVLAAVRKKQADQPEIIDIPHTKALAAS